MNELVCEGVCFCTRVWERVQRSSCVRTSRCIRYSPLGLCPMCFCARAGACVNELVCASLYICTVRAHKDFVLLCFCASVPACKRVCRGAQVRDYVRLYSVSPTKASCGANPQGVYTTCWRLPTRALYNVLLCSYESMCR